MTTQIRHSKWLNTTVKNALSGQNMTTTQSLFWAGYGNGTLNGVPDGKDI